MKVYKECVVCGKERIVNEYDIARSPYGLKYCGVCIMNSPEYLENAKKCQLKRYEDVNERLKIGIAMKKVYQERPDVKERIVTKLLETNRNPEIRKRVIATQKIVFSTPEYKRKRSLHFKSIWNNPEYRPKMLLARSKVGRKIWDNITDEERNIRIKKSLGACRHITTKPEKYLVELLNFMYPNEWRYVGNHEILINGKNPDFININGQKKIIELFGDYWHGELKTGHSTKSEVSNRQNIYAKYGYSTLIIWQHELYNQKRLIDKINKFHEYVEQE